MKIITQEINDGYIAPKIKPEDYILGSGQVPQEILQENGQWTDYYVVEEIQKKNFDTFNCTGFNTTTPLEIQLLRRGEIKNFSDRGLGIFAGTFPPGNDPHTVAEAVRKQGLFNEQLLPFSQQLENVKEYYSYKGGDKALCKTEAKKFKENYFFKHDYLRATSGNVSKETLKEALRYAPLAIAVFAWAKRGGKYFRPENKADTHWTTLIGYKERDHWIVFDSYSPFVKYLEWDFPISVAKRYYIRKRTKEEMLEYLKKQLNLLKIFLIWLSSFIPYLKRYLLEEPKPEPTPEPEPKPKESLLLNWGKAIETYENTAKWRMNPGAIKNIRGEFIIFESYEQGWDYLLDYLNRAATNNHKAYQKGGETTLKEFFEIYAPVFDNNDPIAYANFVAHNLKVATSIKIKELL